MQLVADLKWIKNQPIEILKTLKKFLQLSQEKDRAQQKKAKKYLMKTMN